MTAFCTNTAFMNPRALHEKNITAFLCLCRKMLPLKISFKTFWNNLKVLFVAVFSCYAKPSSAIFSYCAICLLFFQLEKGMYKNLRLLIAQRGCTKISSSYRRNWKVLTWSSLSTKRNRVSTSIRSHHLCSAVKKLSNAGFSFSMLNTMKKLCNKGPCILKTVNSCPVNNFQFSNFTGAKVVWSPSKKYSAKFKLLFVK